MNLEHARGEHEVVELHLAMARTCWAHGLTRAQTRAAVETACRAACQTWQQHGLRCADVDETSDPTFVRGVVAELDRLLAQRREEGR